MVVNKNASPTDAGPTSKATPRHGHRPTEPRPRHPPYSFCHSTRCISPAALRSASHALPQDTLHCLQLLLCAKRLVSLTSSPRWCLPPGIIPSPSSVATLLLPTGHCNDVAVGLAFAATRSRWKSSFKVAQLMFKSTTRASERHVISSSLQVHVPRNNEHGPAVADK